MFSETKAQRFLVRQPWDHAIDLKLDAPKTLDSKTYPLPVWQQKALDEFLKEHSKKGYICISKSPYAAPFFFVKKKDGKLKPVQDYRKLNEYTVKNKYPIPLIKELINQLIGKHWFTKFDIQCPKKLIKYLVLLHCFNDISTTRPYYIIYLVLFKSL